MHGDQASPLETATELLSRAVHDMERPIADLAAAVGRMSVRIHGDAHDLRESLAGDLAICIQSLQFHDRLTQQLAAARSLLSGRSGHTHLLTQSRGETAAEGSIEWFL